MRLAQTLIQNSKVLYPSMKHFLLESQYFDFHQAKSKSAKLKPEHFPKENDQNKKYAKKRLTEANIMKEIDNNRPIYLNTPWQGNKETYFTIIYGYELNHDGFIIHISDPWDGMHSMTYEIFDAEYRNINLSNQA